MDSLGRRRARASRRSGAALLYCVALAGAPAARAADPEEYVGDALCRGCHSVEAEHWDATVHARAFAHPRTELEARTCEACHGPGRRHVEQPRSDTIVAFTRGSKQDPEAMNAMCLACHRGGPLLQWAGSAHDVHDLACSDCHNPMAPRSAQGLLREERVSETCFGCHAKQRGEFRKRSHMPLLEGKISCVDCHDPHGSNTDPLLRADDVRELCTSCHAEKRGPFLWEHAPAQESCLLCHQPHGSNHERLLVTSLPLLCQECHSPIDHPNFAHPSGLLTNQNLPGAGNPDERLLGRACLNCHSQIHGSNHPSGPRFHR